MSGAVPRVAVAPLALLAACRAAPPSPPEYRWPESFSYRLEVTTAPGPGDTASSNQPDVRVLTIGRRDDLYRVRLDTIEFRVELGSRAELARVERSCDPALAPCRAASPPLLRRELRRIMPRLSIWPVAPGGTWADTVELADALAPGDSGRVVTTYTPGPGDTIAGRRYWRIRWRAVHTTASGPVSEEEGATLVDQRTRLPVYSLWTGRSAGSGASYSGKAYLPDLDSARAGAPGP